MKEPDLKELKLTKREKLVLEFIFKMNFDGDHHKQWQLDQIVRMLTKNKYDEYVKYMNYGENTYDWDIGVAP